eukprot:1160484-Pelagomonas_calceolata.AAC.7
MSNKRRALRKKLGIIKFIQSQLKPHASTHWEPEVDSAKTIIEQNKENQALCNAIMGLEYIDFDLPLLQQIETISSSTKGAMKYIDETRNKDSNNIVRKQLNKLINKNPKQAHREIFRDKIRFYDAQPRACLQALRGPGTTTIEKHYVGRGNSLYIN